MVQRAHNTLTMKFYSYNDNYIHIFQRFTGEVTNSDYKYFYTVEQVKTWFTVDVLVAILIETHGHLQALDQHRFVPQVMTIALALGMGHFNARFKKKKIFHPIVAKEWYYQNSGNAFNKRVTPLDCTGQCSKASQIRWHLSPNLSFSTFSTIRTPLPLFYFLFFYCSPYFEDF